jgi:hypothetical protein
MEIDACGQELVNRIAGESIAQQKAPRKPTLRRAA